MRFNSDTGSNYSTHQLSGNGSVTESYGTANTNYIAIGKANYSGANSSMFAPGVYDILDYKNTNKYKTARSLTGVESNGTAGQQVALLSGSWRNTASITSINLFPTSGNFTQYTQFALYGIKGS
jgi:hypothetical protein